MLVNPDDLAEHMLKSKCRRFLLIFLLGLLLRESHAADWPMWRADASRSAASDEELGGDLKLAWNRAYSARTPAWSDTLNRDLMAYDRLFEPIVHAGRLFVGFNAEAKLVAIDAKSGDELWTFYAEGPVRLPPAAANGKVYFVSDDGFLYCLDAASGELIWKMRGGPSSQHALGNKRLVSAWPARGGPVIRDGTVYFAASIWPFMGTFIYALDAETGAVQWTNDGTGAHFTKQPHSAPSFAGVGPQGALVATSDTLLVPGGRSVPAAFDRDSGQLLYFEINAGGKGNGGSFVAADESHFYLHTRGKATRAFQLKDGIKTAFVPHEPVLYDGFVISAETTGEEETPVVRAYGPDHKLVWEVNANGTGDLIKAGSRLYAAAEETIQVIALPTEGSPATVLQSLPCEGKVARLLAAAGHLFAVTEDGNILAFRAGDLGSEPVHHAARQAGPAPTTLTDKGSIDELLTQGTAEGYALWFGAADPELILSMAVASPFVQFAVVDQDPTRVTSLRKQLDECGLYGKVTVHHSSAGTFRAPSYVANMVFVDQEILAQEGRGVLREIYRSVRPYGGTLVVRTDSVEETSQAIADLDLEQAKLSDFLHGLVVRREGALPGSADWTHQYGDIANTIKSNDQRVKLPLGVLWFGGNTNEDILPRHGHGPPEQVLGGRLFVEGFNSLSARDVYTGRELWKREFEDLGTFDVYYDATYNDTPLSTRYNQVHIPGANGRGTNYVVTEEHIYLLVGSTCHVLSPATGETQFKIELPQEEGEPPLEWGYVGVYKNVLLAGHGFARYRTRHSLKFDADAKLTGNRAGFGAKSLDRAASRALIGFDRFTGKQLWRVPATHSFWHNGIVAGHDKVFCLDRNPKSIEDALKRRGRPTPDTYRIVSLDYRTGEKIWEVSEGIFGTWLGFSEEKDLLLQAGAAASDRLKDEVGTGMVVYEGSSGAVRWRKDDLRYAGPCILHHDLIITNANSYTESAGAFHLEDGKQKLIENPLTQDLVPWKLERAYGCNNIIASENLLTFRSGAAGFYDLTQESGTGNFGGFKSGCTSNLVVANGVLNAPDYTRTCSCSYQNQTSLALVHMPGVDLWTIDNAAIKGQAAKRVNRLGVNFGAPGDRRDRAGTLWLEHPVVAGNSPLFDFEINSGASFFRHHSAKMAEAELPWVMSSGAVGVTDISMSLRLGIPFTLPTGLPPSSSKDSGYEDAEGKVRLGTSVLQLGQKSAVAAFRFSRLDLPRDARISKAYLQFTSQSPALAPANFTITAEKVADSESLTEDDGNLSQKPQTEALVGWEVPVWQSANARSRAQATPDLAPILRELLHQDEWQPQNGVTFMIQGSGTRDIKAARERHLDSPRLVVLLEDELLDEAGKLYQVKLYFGSPEVAKLQPTTFDVYVQGDLKSADVQVDSTSGSRGTTLTIDDVLIEERLRLRLVPKLGKPVLSGIELIQDDSAL